VNKIAYTSAASNPVAKVVLLSLAAATVALGGVLAPLTSSGAQTEYKHVNSEGNAGWKNELELWLNTLRPRMENIHGSLSNGRDFHMNVARDGDGPPVELYCVPESQAAQVQQQPETEIAVIGFNVSSPPCLWVVRKK
jgi:hypothetical protein